MKYAVSGGIGFIGSNLVDRLLSDNHEVIIIDNLSSEESKKRWESGELGYWNKYNYSFIEKDVSEIEDFSFLDNVDSMFHLAALPRVQPSIEDPIKYHNANVNGTLNLLYGSVKSGIRRFIFSSSSAVYGDVTTVPTNEKSELQPMSPYSLHKLIGEQYCSLFEKLYGLETFSLRYFNAYGERQPLSGPYSLVMGIFANQIINGQPITINGDGEQRRDFVYVGDIVNANIICTKIKHTKNNIFNIGSGKNYSVNELANLLSKTAPRLNNPPVIEPRLTLADISNAKKKLNWEPKEKLEAWIETYKKEIGIN